ncbi:MAG: C69 family dipeptidase [Acidobacteriota bacterium]|nr:C69 family dipeptidase [Acidobacteriota bacterium]MDW3229726.1 C69 family dipeptidase [Acidobacteriota bacterium]MDY0231587.1 C69 family dipeptidase [Candidatus Saccharicenans sp.]
MRKISRSFLLVVLLLFSLNLFLQAADKDALNCYTVLVGKKASADGSVIVAHNEDDYGEIMVNVRKIAPHDYGPKVKINLRRGAVYETSGQTNGFLWIEATGQEFADSFINEYGVVITSDSCPSRETKEDYTDGGIGYMLRRIVAEKARTAREAVILAGELVEKYGYIGSGRTYSIADKNEAWMLAVIRGRHWFAQRVPDDEVAVIPNYYTIRQIRLDDPDYYLGSPDIIEYAKNNGWYDETRDGQFDFKKAFARPSKRNPVFDGNSLRMWRGVVMLSGKNREIDDDFPFSFKPAQKVTPEVLMTLLRDHYEGTECDATHGYKEGSPNRTKFRTICTSSTINSLVACLNDQKPEPISILVWLALGKPDTTVYLPLYYGLEKLPEGLGYGHTNHDYELFYRQHFEPNELLTVKDQLLHSQVRRFEKLVEENYGQMINVVKTKLLPLEKQYLEGHKLFELKLTSLFQKNQKEAQKNLNDYITSAFNSLRQIYQQLAKNYN